jgi:hypothetical protein
MRDTEENKNVKKKVEPRLKKRTVDSLESRNIRHQRHDFKYKKMDIQQEELWEEWQEYYK